MDDVKVDHPAPIITPPHSRNDVNPAPSDYTPNIILTAVLSRQVEAIYNFGDIPIIVGFHNNCFLWNVFSHPPNLTHIL